MFTLPKLPYDYNALEPYFDEATMKLHHGKHHQTYVDKLNATLEKYPDLQEKSVNELLDNLETLPEAIRGAVRNNAGGHWNHSFFWESLIPASQFKEPAGDLLEVLNKNFESLENFKKLFKEAALARFGSGWLWLGLDGAGRMVIESTANQDPPQSHVILGLDVWEHAYYLKYQNRRADYVEAFWSVVHWSRAGTLLSGK